MFYSTSPAAFSASTNTPCNCASAKPSGGVSGRDSEAPGASGMQGNRSSTRLDKPPWLRHLALAQAHRHLREAAARRCRRRPFRGASRGRQRSTDGDATHAACPRRPGPHAACDRSCRGQCGPSRKRTSCLAGCTFTSTRAGSMSRYSTKAGWRHGRAHRHKPDARRGQSGDRAPGAR